MIMIDQSVYYPSLSEFRIPFIGYFNGDGQIGYFQEELYESLLQQEIRQIIITQRYYQISHNKTQK